MTELWRVVSELVVALNRDRLESLADAIGNLNNPKQVDGVRSSFGPNIDPQLFQRFKAAWQAEPVQSGEIAAALNVGAQVSAVVGEQENVDLVWTGPSGLIPTRYTEQVLIEVIDSAKRQLFVVSYVFYKANSIIEALNRATDRGVRVQILLEPSKDQGGAISFDGIKLMGEAVPSANIYIWEPEAKRDFTQGLGASVHAKCAVADDSMAFITSANLTSAAMERNMELGVLCRGGRIPSRLQEHLQTLVSTKILKRSDL